VVGEPFHDLVGELSLDGVNQFHHRTPSNFPPTLH
jgi:hypothetical protein